jgi:predicted PurR-regulated permease PerM
MILNIAFPFILALFIAYLINPAVEGFEKIGLKRRTSIIYVYILFISILLGIFVLLLPQLYKNIRELTFAIPQIALEYNSKVNLLLDFVVKSGFPADFTNTLLAETISSVKTFELYSVAKLKDMLIDSIMLLPSLLGLLLSLIIAYYFLRDIELFKKFVYSLVPSKFRNDVSIAGREINLVIKNFIQGQLLTMVAVACLEVIGL